MTADAAAAALFAPAARAFRRFFDELRGAFLERETLFSQIELALLCREHVLVVGPPGTAKSAIAASVLGRITDESTGVASLFAKQLSESTVQADLIGPVDFKVLTETGRTEHLTDEGMLGATHAFLDEVFDGREMLLRSILNVLYERELKHGRKVTPGRFECAIMTSNRYLSEVLARSPDLLLAFSDRLSFVSFTPKGFARPQSRAAMLSRSMASQRPRLGAALTHQQLGALQAAVERVAVPPLVSDGLERLADHLERELQAQVTKLPDYVPTKYFSQRSLVKAMWALKAVVVRDRIYRDGGRALEARLDDLESLDHFFLLGGPPGSEVELLARGVVDPRERAQLEIIRLEQRAFATVVAKAKAEARSGAEAEAQQQGSEELRVAAEELSRGFNAQRAEEVARRLRERLMPGPRYPENRDTLLAAARAVLSAALRKMTTAGQPHADGGSAGALPASLLEALLALTEAPELAPGGRPLVEAAFSLARRAVAQAELAAMGSEFQVELKSEALVSLATSVELDLRVMAQVAGGLAVHAPELAAELSTSIEAARRGAGAALARRSSALVSQRTARDGDPAAFDGLALEAQRLEALEAAVVRLSTEHAGLREKLLWPAAKEHAHHSVARAGFASVEQLARLLQELSERLRRIGVEPERLLAEERELIESRLFDHFERTGLAPRVPSLDAAKALAGDAYTFYRDQLTGLGAEGELGALKGLEATVAPRGAGFLTDELKQRAAAAELALLASRVRFLGTWLSLLLQALPAPESLRTRAEADGVFDRLVKSRFPLLVTREGELVRVQGALSDLATFGGPVGERVSQLDTEVHAVAQDFGAFSRRLLEVRAGL